MADNVKLIKECQRKSKKAFDKLYLTYSPLVYGICLRYTKNESEAQDLLQECFIKILNKLPYYKFKGSFEGWLRKLTVNQSINYLRSKKYFLTEDKITEYEGDSNIKEPDIISRLSAEEIIKMINQLPDGYRTIFNLHVIEGYKHIEIAEKLGISDATCRTQYKKARESLIKMINNNK